MGQQDAALRHSMECYPNDWARFLGVKKDVRVESLDSDRSTISPRLDKLYRVLDDPPWAMIVDPISYLDAWLDTRVLLYEAVVRHILKIEAHSYVLFLYPRAWGAAIRGGVRSLKSRGRSRIRFGYEVIKVWELPVEKILTAGVGLLPLAPLANVSADEVPHVIEEMSRRLSSEVPRREAADLWTAAHILMGVRFGKEATNQFLRTVREVMRDSPTYIEILEEGIEQGIEKGIVQGIERGLSQGETRAMHAALLRQGQKRFRTAPSPADRARIESLTDHELLDTLLLRLLDVTSWDDLLAGIPRNGGSN